MNARGFELKSARFLAADCLRRFLLPGDIAVDATMGNGHDTQMLCDLVGEHPRTAGGGRPAGARYAVSLRTSGDGAVCADFCAIRDVQSWLAAGRR